MFKDYKAANQGSKSDTNSDMKIKKLNKVIEFRSNSESNRNKKAADTVASRGLKLSW
jgi:hypothetical protein